MILMGDEIARTQNGNNNAYCQDNITTWFDWDRKKDFEDIFSFTKNMIEIYEKYKLEQGYSRYEIAQKREALENVLIPYTEQENMALAKQAGFKDIQCVFKWGNFATFVAFK